MPAIGFLSGGTKSSDGWRRRRFLQIITGGFAIPIVSRTVRAQDYPTRPITMIIPFGPGGPIDTLARFTVERMQASLGQPVIVENIVGASGGIGVSRVARSMPDGHTLVIGTWSTHVVNEAVYSLSYDVLNDFEPVALLTNNSQLIVGTRAITANDLQGLIAWLKANPEKVFAGTTGVGSAEHIFGILFQHATGTRFQFVHYSGAPQAMLDLVAGRIQIMIADQVTALPQVHEGNIKAFAFTGRSRLAAAPSLPTTDEAGLPGFHTSVWVGIWAPKGTPKSITARLNNAVMDALDDEAARQRLAALGQQVVPREQQSSESLRTLQKQEIEKWWPIIKAAGIKAE
jgi:tripartite-type tricarboxylate transporter receptor subunit TctC